MVIEAIEKVILDILPFEFVRDNRAKVFTLSEKICCTNPKPFQFIRIYRKGGTSYEIRRCDSCGKEVYVQKKEGEHSAA